MELISSLALIAQTLTGEPAHALYDALKGVKARVVHLGTLKSAEVDCRKIRRGCETEYDCRITDLHEPASGPFTLHSTRQACFGAGEEPQDDAASLYEALPGSGERKRMEVGCQALLEVNDSYFCRLTNL